MNETGSNHAMFNSMYAINEAHFTLTRSTLILNAKMMYGHKISHFFLSLTLNLQLELNNIHNINMINYQLKISVNIIDCLSDIG